MSTFPDDHINVTDYGVIGDGTTVNNLAALNAALAPGVRVFWPAGHYIIGAAFAQVQYVTHYGPSASGDPYETGLTNVPSALLTWTSSSMLAPRGTGPANATLTGMVFENLGLETTANHLIDLSSNGGLTYSSFKNCFFRSTSAPGAAFLNQTVSTIGGNTLFGNVWENCRFQRSPNATAPAFNIQTNGGTSHLRFLGGEWASGGAPTPFFKAEATGSAEMSGLIFDAVIGEQNQGGMIHLGSPSGAHIRGVVDYDQGALAQYSNHLFYIYQVAGAAVPKGVTIDGSGTDAGTSWPSGNFLLNLLSAEQCHIGMLQQGDNVASPTLVNVNNAYNSVQWGPTPNRGVQVITTAYSATQFDDVIVFNSGATATVTLPHSNNNRSTYPVGKQITVLNMGNGTVTVASDWVNGGTSKALTGAYTHATFLAMPFGWVTIA